MLRSLGALVFSTLVAAVGPAHAGGRDGGSDLTETRAHLEAAATAERPRARRSHGAGIFLSAWHSAETGRTYRVLTPEAARASLVERFVGGRGGRLTERGRESQRALATAGRELFAVPSFEVRAREHAAIVAQEASGGFQLAFGLGPRRAERARALLRAAATDAGLAFAPAFTRDGSPRRDRVAEYQAAYQEATIAINRGYAARLVAITLRGTPRMWRPRIERVLTEASADDLVELTRAVLGLRRAPIDGRAVIEHVLARHPAPVDASDGYGGFLRRQAEALAGRGGDGRRLAGQDGKVLEILARLANTTWQSGQVHRAVWEGKLRRVETTEDFNPFDQVIAGEYRRSLDGARSRGDRRAMQAAFAETVFKVFLDLGAFH